jgi:hypothetical protein
MTQLTRQGMWVLTANPVESRLSGHMWVCNYGEHHPEEGWVPHKKGETLLWVLIPLTGAAMCRDCWEKSDAEEK